MRRASVVRILNSFARCELTPLQMLAQLNRARSRPRLKIGKLPLFGLRPYCGSLTIRITRWHIENALAKRREKKLSERDLVIWATMLLINDSFYWEGADAELIGQWICGLSLDL